MTATHTFDLFSSLDGYGSHSGNWGGYWCRQGPELLDCRLALHGEEQRMVFEANTYRAIRADAGLRLSAISVSASAGAAEREQGLRFVGRGRLGLGLTGQRCGETVGGVGVARLVKNLPHGCSELARPRISSSPVAGTEP